MSAVSRTQKSGSCLKSRAGTSRRETAEQLQKHLIVFDDGGLRFGCNVCKQRFISTKTLKRHIRKYSGKCSESCVVRGKRELAAKLQKYLIVFDDGDMRFGCNVCERKYSTLKSLKDHITKYSGKCLKGHVVRSRRETAEELQKYMIAFDDGGLRFGCNVCKHRYSSLSSLRNHIKYYAGTCFNNRVYRKKGEVEDELQKYLTVFDDGSRRFGCKVCMRRYKLLGSLKLHIRLYAGSHVVNCDLCKKSFTTKSELHVHRRLQHDEAPVECAICSRSFKNKFRLRAHMRDHSDEKPYKCSHCDKKFWTKQTLRIHTPVHDTQQQYNCDTCGQRFVVKNQLIVHMRKHTGELPYSCQHCARKFRSSALLQKHMLSHGEKEYKCGICGKRFARTDSLKMHLKHTQMNAITSVITVAEGFAQTAIFRNIYVLLILQTL